MLASSLLWEGIPRLSGQSWLKLIVLAVVNTAFTFMMWNNTLQTLTAMESSIINGMMLVVISIFSWVFLDEAQSLQEVAGLTLAFVGARIVNIRIERKR